MCMHTPSHSCRWLSLRRSLFSLCLSLCPRLPPPPPPPPPRLPPPPPHGGGAAKEYFIENDDGTFEYGYVVDGVQYVCKYDKDMAMTSDGPASSEGESSDGLDGGLL